jgi:hypothetical protein
MDDFDGERDWYAERVPRWRSRGAPRKCANLTVSLRPFRVPSAKSMHAEIVLGSDVHVTVTMRICMSTEKG